MGNLQKFGKKTFLARCQSRVKNNTSSIHFQAFIHNVNKLEQSSSVGTCVGEGLGHSDEDAILMKMQTVTSWRKWHCTSDIFMIWLHNSLLHENYILAVTS